MTDPRPIVVCPKCGMKQYMTMTGSCRKPDCRWNLITPLPEKKSLVATAPKPVNIPDRNIKEFLARKNAEARKARGLTQKQQAELAGLTRGQVLNFERGCKDVLVDTLCRVALGLGLEPADLLPTKAEYLVLHQRQKNAPQAILEGEHDAD